MEGKKQLGKDKPVEVKKELNEDGDNTLSTSEFVIFELFSSLGFWTVFNGVALVSEVSIELLLQHRLHFVDRESRRHVEVGLHF